MFFDPRRVEAGSRCGGSVRCCRRSTKLSYGARLRHRWDSNPRLPASDAITEHCRPAASWCAFWDLNPEPSACGAAALPLS